MAVRAKFKVVGYESAQFTRTIDSSKPYSSENLELAELRTIKLNPVYGNGDPNHENTKFWNATPSGEIRLGMVNPEAWKHFELGKEYYLDFTEAN